MQKQPFNNELHNLAETIKELRELFKLSQERLGKMTGLSRSVIGDLEQERRFPSMPTLLKLCKVFNITPSELVAEAFADWQITTNKEERNLLHKALRNNMNKIVTDAAIREFKKG